MELHLSPAGNDRWSGRLPEPNPARTDGPLATFDGVRAALQALRRPTRRDPDPIRQVAAIDGPVTVHVRGGRYELDRPVVFRPEDSAPVTFRAAPGERPVLDGGRRLEGWRETTRNGRRAWVAAIPEVAAGTWYFRQLFVNGRRAARPRLPKEGFFPVEEVLDAGDPAKAGWGQPGSHRFRCREGDVRPWRNLTDVEVVAFHFWVDERMPVAAFDPATRIVSSTRTSRAPLVLAWNAGNAVYFAENVFEALTEPGEWYLDRSSGECWYLPREGETLAEAEMVAPRAYQLLRLVGDPAADRFVEWIRFEGLTFRHTEWAMPGDPGPDPRCFESSDVRVHGLERSASGPQAAAAIPGAVLLRGARHCAFEDCTFERLGWYGLEVEAGCTGVRIVGNTFRDLGAGGVKIGGTDAEGPVHGRTGWNRVTDNEMTALGRVFHAAVGVLARHTFGNVIAHNHIHDLYYSGISVGWVWGYGDSVSRENRIEANHIHDLGKGWLSDMGGVYTLGVQPGTTIRGNLIHDVACRKYGGWAVYPDEGSSHLVIEDNVCFRTTSAVFHQHYGRENTVRNNVFALGGEGIVALGKAEGHVGFTMYRNVLLSDGEPLFAGGYGWDVRQPGAVDSFSNLVWDLRGRPVAARPKGHGAGGDVRGAPLPWDAWQRLGLDLGSVVADPRLRDPAGGDFLPAADSPAFALGFRPIDLSRVGPRPRGERG